MPASKATSRNSNSSDNSLAEAVRAPSAEEVVEASTSLVKQNPMTASITAFGVGIGIGVLAGVAIADAAISARTARTPDGYGEQLLEALRRMSSSSFTR